MKLAFELCLTYLDFSAFQQNAKETVFLRPYYCARKYWYRSLSSVYKEETLACHRYNFPIQQKYRLFNGVFFKFYFIKQPSLLLNGEVIWQASDWSLSKELHVQIGV